jgi:hypothetical protein
VAGQRRAAEIQVSVQVERRDIVAVVVHGILAGLLSGLVLGILVLLVSVGFGQPADTPFRFAAALVVGPAAFSDAFPIAIAVLLGVVMHLVLAAGIGIAFIGLLSLTYQLSARWQLLVLYGALFAFSVWEIDFLVAVPTFFGYLVDRLTITAQLWNGILPYVFVYGPLLGLYVAWRRPGVIDDWQAVGPPAGVFLAPTSVSPAPPDSTPDTGRQG